MRTVNATAFKSQCLQILDTLSPEGIVVTKRGKPVARVIPFQRKSVADFYGCLKDTIQVEGDIFSTGLTWHAQP